MKRSDDDVQVSVGDTGPGIDSKDLPLVFDAYWSGSREGRHGTGLGLYITRRIIDAHDNRIWIESEVGRGTKVHFTLNRVRPAHSTQKGSAAASESC